MGHRGSTGRRPHLKRDPLVLSSFTESMSEKEHVIHSDPESQEGQHLLDTHRELGQDKRINSLFSSLVIKKAFGLFFGRSLLISIFRLHHEAVSQK